MFRAILVELFAVLWLVGSIWCLARHTRRAAHRGTLPRRFLDRVLFVALWGILFLTPVWLGFAAFYLIEGSPEKEKE
jgi:hypothetical protein